MSSRCDRGILEMKFILSIYLWTVGLLYFVIFLFFALFVSLFYKPYQYDPWLKSMLRYFFKILWIGVEVEGLEQLKSEKTYLFMSNHVSLFDIPLLGGFVPGFVRGIEARRQHQWFLYGWVMGRLGNIPIDRGKIHQSIKTIRQTIKIMKTGISIIVLPEGHRTLDGKLRSFKKLPFYLAKQVESDIVPIGLSGLFYLKRKGSWIIRPTTLKIKFGTAVSLDEIQSLSIVDLRDKVRERIQGLIERP
jgi:1-acyl-sn-glycerol-3-phosphate acyltransferase